jgi:hypothetical protein
VAGGVSDVEDDIPDRRFDIDDTFGRLGIRSDREDPRRKEDRYRHDRVPARPEAP